MDAAHQLTLPKALVDRDRAGWALFFDIDGVLAAIEQDPEAVAVPEATLELLATLVGQVAAVGVVTGRRLADARRLVPVEGVWYAASHGMHVRDPDGAEEVDPRAAAARPQLELAAQLARTVGWKHEDKEFSVTMHFRDAANPEQVERGMRAHLATVLDPRVVGVHKARMAIEVRPIGARTKAFGVEHVVGALGDRVTAGAYLGDDWTDVDAFHGLERCVRPAVRVAVASPEAPSELLELGDVVLRHQADVQEFLRALAS